MFDKYWQILNCKSEILVIISIFVEKFDSETMRL